MKSILISIKPKWVAKILNGEKTIEIRKTMPKCDLPIDVYIYCTKSDIKGARENLTFEQLQLLGKVVAKFTLNKVEKVLEHITNTYMSYCTNSLSCDEFFEKSCLTIDELENYLNWNAGGYAWHISNLEIFDKPKWLIDFKTKVYPNKKDSLITKSITKAPQSWQFIESEN